MAAAKEKVMGKKKIILFELRTREIAIALGDISTKGKTDDK